MPLPATDKRLNVFEALELAATLCRQRRLGEAEQLYRVVLQLRPGNAEALHGLGIVCRQTKRLDEAVSLLTQLVTINASNAGAHNDLGLALAQLRRPDAAVAAFRRAIAARPDFFEAYNSLGNLLLTRGQANEAVAQFKVAHALKPERPEILSNLGNALAATGRHEEALASFRRALELRPDFALAHHHLALTLTALNRPQEAVAQFERIIALQPRNVDAYVRLANLLITLQRPSEALAKLKLALAIDPRSAAAQGGTGNVLAILGRHAEAIPHLQEAVALAPDVAEFHNNLGNSLTALNRCEEAVLHFHKASALKPGFSAPYGNLGNALEILGRMDEALAAYQAAVAAEPNLPAAYNNMGNVLRNLGRFEESRKSFEKAIELLPAKAEYYRGLADSMDFTAADDPYLSAMEQLAKTDTLSDSERAELDFALGKAYDDLGMYEAAFPCFLEGNRITRRQVQYDEAETLEQLRRTAAIFTPELMREKQGFSDPSAVPVFIVGMPRSGSTLIEQILASHPQVYGAGELPEFSKFTGDICQPEGATIPFPEIMLSISGSELTRLGKEYLAAVTAMAPTATRITDKMPSNFRLLGLIHLVLPHAKIIHARRDPADTCFSCFSKMFRRNQPFTYDLRELGRYYRAYERLMAHWRQVLPKGAMLDVQYEKLVADFEPQARRIVAHCGLAWESRCLAFHKTERPVRTASSMQVRQPLYRNAVGRWRHYQTWLTPLLEELGLDFATG